MLIQWTESWAGLEKPGMGEEAPKNQCQQAAAGDTGRDPGVGAREGPSHGQDLSLALTRLSSHLALFPFFPFWLAELKLTSEPC